MAAGKSGYSDEEFISLWQRLGSATLVAQETGIAIRNVFKRRRNIEQRLGIILQIESVGEIKEMVFLEEIIEDGVVLVASDLHCWPGVITTGQKAFLWAIAELQPDVIVLNGDVFDGCQVSRFGANERNKLPTVAKELEACREYLWAIREVAPEGCRLVWVMGNHDQRFVRKLIEGAGEFEGIPGFDIRDHFPDWEMCYRFTVNPNDAGMTDFVHNWAGGIHAAYNNTLRAGCNYVTGHTHRLMDRPWNDRTGRRYGIETGTLTDTDGPQSYYVAGRPVDWGSGFPVLTYNNSVLLRPEYIDVVDDGVFAFRSECYEI